MKKLLYLIIAGALIFSCVDDIFATNYKQMGKVYWQGNFTYDGWVKAYENTLVANATTITLNNLVGNTAVEYALEIRFIAGATAGVYLLIFNGDTGSNYGQQRIYAGGATAGALRSTRSDILLIADGGGVSQGFYPFYAKSGYGRTLIRETLENVVGTTIDQIYIAGYSWSNTTAEIINATIIGNSDDIGIGSYTCLWKRVYKQ